MLLDGALLVKTFRVNPQDSCDTVAAEEKVAVWINHILPNPLSLCCVEEQCHEACHTHTSIFIKDLSTLVAYLWYSDVLVWLLSWEKGSWRLFFEESFLGASQMP